MFFNKFINKIKTKSKISVKYNFLFGHGNWRIIDYQFKKGFEPFNDGITIGGGGWDTKEESYKIKVINPILTDSNGLNDNQLEKISNDMNRYDYRLIYNFNNSLYKKMEKYITRSFIEKEVISKFISDYKKIHGFNPHYNDYSFTEKIKMLKNMSTIDFIKNYIEIEIPEESDE